MKNHISTPWFFLLAIAASVGTTFFLRQTTHALVKPTLSASVDSANIQVNGTDVIESASGTTDTPVNVSVKTNNRSGYTVTVSSTSEETALTDSNLLNDTKISSITSNYTLADLPVNQWGLRLDSEALYSPIQPRGHAKVIATTTAKNDTEETNTFHVGMKLNSSLRTGNYQNKLLVSITTNPVENYAELNGGYYFHDAMSMLTGGQLENIKHVKYSHDAPSSDVNTVNIQNEDVSDVPVLMWYENSSNTIYYYADVPKIYFGRSTQFMFRNCFNIEDIDLSPMDTSKVVKFGHMFEDLRKLKKIDLSNFDTSNAVDMSYMFTDCESLTELDLSSFNTEKVKDMTAMFAGAKSLEKLNVTSFNTSNVTDIQVMFSETLSLKTLDLTSFNTSKVVEFFDMFGGSKEYTSIRNDLKTIYVSEDFDISSLSANSKTLSVFGNRYGLCGGNGTCYSSSHSNYEYLRIDRPGAPGYFTYKAKP